MAILRLVSVKSLFVPADSHPTCQLEIEDALLSGRVTNPTPVKNEENSVINKTTQRIAARLGVLWFTTLATVASAETCKPSQWGADDEVGAANRFSTAGV